MNKGLIQDNGGNGQNNILDILTSVTLSGGGTVTMSMVPNPMAAVRSSRATARP